MRQAAYLIHASLIEKNKRVDVTEWMPLPFDEDIEAHKKAVMSRRQKEYMEIKRKLAEQEINGN